MRVVFSDPQGPRLARLVPYLPPLAMLALVLEGPWWDGLTAFFGVLLSLGLVALASILPLRQRKARPVELACGPGFVTVKKAGSRNQRIDARSITGATTARTSRGILFTLQHSKRDQPITIEVENEAEAEKIRHSLGIGHGGYGTIGWHAAATSTQSSGFWGRLITFVVATTIASLGLFVSEEAAGMTAIGTVHLGLICAILGIAGWVNKPVVPSVQMTAQGLMLNTTRGWFSVPYDHVLGIETTPKMLRFVVPPPYNVIEVEMTTDLKGTGLALEDRDRLAKQIMSASARARGLGPSKNDVTGRLDVLRRNGENPRSWLERLDMTGRMLENAGIGYRGHTLDESDLWSILEDPEAEADLRAAAARVLRHLGRPETRVRIDTAVAAVRDESTSRRLRIAVRDDVDNASEELALLDAQEQIAHQQKRMHMAMPAPPFVPMR